MSTYIAHCHLQKAFYVLIDGTLARPLTERINLITQNVFHVATVLQICKIPLIFAVFGGKVTL